MEEESQKEETTKKLSELKAYDTGEPLIREITFNFYHALEYIGEGQKKGAISKEDYEEIKEEFEKLESKLEEKGIIEED